MKHKDMREASVSHTTSICILEVSTAMSACTHLLSCVATALSFSTDDSSPQPIQSPGGSSTASSRDASPSREISPLVNSLKPPTIIRRGPQGFGFTIRAIRVYFGDSDYYTVHHLVMVSPCIMVDSSATNRSPLSPFLKHFRAQATREWEWIH